MEKLSALELIVIGIAIRAMAQTPDAARFKTLCLHIDKRLIEEVSARDIKESLYHVKI